MGLIMHEDISYSGGGGSKGGSRIVVTTTESSLYGKTVTISDGTITISDTFSNSGSVTFEGVTLTGNLTVTSTDGTDTARLILRVPYYGNYNARLTFWSATVNIQGDENLYNANITVKNSLHATVDTILLDSNGQGTFYATEADTYTFEYTYSGETYSKDLVVSAETTYSILLDTIPNGSTALPVNDIQIWLRCAGITDKAYTTLAEVLADTDTYTTLLGDSNACDYMARSTTWALAEGLVPTMTSNTTPSGTASAISEYDTAHAAWKAFDGDDSSTSFWVSSAGSSTSYSNLYVGYTFTEAKIIRSYYVKFKSEATACTYKLQGSNDGTNWTDIGSTSTKLDGLNYVDNDTAYTSYRLFIVSQTTSATSYNGGRVLTLQFYENADITNNADAMHLLGMYDYACDVLLSDATWASAIANSTYFESVLDTKVPKMTSATTPSGEVFATAVIASHPPYVAFLVMILELLLR